ncbi:hypothetical protein T484DRAFT_3584334 [Baffinella frigidus]|nr:hypothetical protein T484DRAFT_3584334 [Cryptophyta sp. CCMP2293]
MDEARRMFEKAIEIRPSDAGALCGYARMLQDDGEVDRAEDMFAQALEENPRDPAVLCGYAMLLGGPGLVDEPSEARAMVNSRRAGEMLQLAADLAPEDATMQYQYAAYLQTEVQDYDQAAVFFRRAVQCDPADPSPEILFRHANLMQFRLRDYAGAEQLYRRLLSNPSLDPKLLTEALANYGLLLCNCLRRYSAAHRVLERVLEIAPDHDEARLGFKFCLMLEERSRTERRGGARAPLDPEPSTLSPRP